MMSISVKSPRKQKGFALLATWVLVLALILTLGTVFYRHQLDVSRTAQILHTDQALLLALSVENYAVQMLSPDYDDIDVDHLQEDWALPIPPLPVDGGVVSGCLVDMQSRLNLNSLATYTDRRMDEELNPVDEPENDEGGGERNEGVGHLSTLIALTDMLQWPVTQAQIASLIDWTDRNNQPVNSSGAEQLQYDNSRVRVMVPNSPLENVAELSLLSGYDQDFIQLIQPYVVTLPQETTININTASEAILTVVGGNRSEAFASLVMQGRPFYTLTDLHLQLEQTLGMETVEVQRLWGENRISVNTEYFMIYLQVSIGSANIEVESLLNRQDNGESVVVSRKLTRVPDIDTSALSEEELLLLENPCIFGNAEIDGSS